MTQEALKRVAEKLRRTGASIPAPEVTGTIEGSVVTGLCIALALVEGEIEALAQPEQEPVGVVGWAANVPNTIREVHWKNGSPPIGTMLFTHPPQRTEQEPVCPDCKAEVLYECVACSSNNYPPPQRTWVGLTDEEINEWTPEIHGVIRAIEAKLKEKNCG